MNATLFCKSNFLIFLNAKDEVIGYQLDKSSPDGLKDFRITFPVTPVEGTEKTLVLIDVWSKIFYAKEKIDSDIATITGYEINENNLYIQNTVKMHINEAVLINQDARAESSAPDIECPSWIPSKPEFASRRYDCEVCQQEPLCYQSEDVVENYRKYDM